MSAFLKIYTDSAHTAEVAHTTQNTTTLNGAVSAGANSLTLTSTTNWPTEGTLDIIDGTNGNESIPYYGLSGNVVQLGTPTAFAHATGLTVNQWFYQLAVGDQVNGILNDGTNATPNANNTNTWYLYNAGDQTAQSTTLAVNTSASVDTTAGKADTLVSITSATTGFAASVAPGNIAAAAAATQFWVVAEVPSGQSIAGNPQICEVDLTYQSI